MAQLCISRQSRHAEWILTEPVTLTACSIVHEDDWTALLLLCGAEVAEDAAEILDTKCITRVVARGSGRVFFTVESNKSTTHLCIPGFCTCIGFCSNVAAEAPHAVVCKHEMAAMLAEALGKLETQEKSDAEWSSNFQIAAALPMLHFRELEAAAPAPAAPLPPTPLAITCAPSTPAPRMPPPATPVHTASSIQ